MTRPVTITDRFKSSAFWAKSVLWIWAVIMTVACTIMMGRHSIPLPAQSASNQHVSQVLGAHRAPIERDQWMLVHVFFTSCPCSRKLASYLLDRARPDGVTEHVLLVGDDPAWREQATARGFTVHLVEPEELSRHYALQAAPLLVVLDPLDRVRYLGGYTARKQGFAVQDLEILRDVRQDLSVEALPLFGCAVSRELRRVVDPTGWF